MGRQTVPMYTYLYPLTCIDRHIYTYVCIHRHIYTCIYGCVSVHTETERQRVHGRDGERDLF